MKDTDELAAPFETMQQWHWHSNKYGQSAVLKAVGAIQLNNKWEPTQAVKQSEQGRALTTKEH